MSAALERGSAPASRGTRSGRGVGGGFDRDLAVADGDLEILAGAEAPGDFTVYGVDEGLAMGFGFGDEGGEGEGEGLVIEALFLGGP